VCSNLLNESDISEIEIGSKHIEKISDTLNRHLFRSKDWRQITDNLSLEIENLKQVYQFVSKQLILDANKSKKYCQLMSIESKKNDDTLAIIQSNHSQEKYAIQQKILALEDELNKKDDELTELKLAYKEKLRKCIAWEKVYKTFFHS
jgi:hypothetical protein